MHKLYIQAQSCRVGRQWVSFIHAPQITVIRGSKAHSLCVSSKHGRLRWCIAPAMFMLQTMFKIASLTELERNMTEGKLERERQTMWGIEKKKTSKKAKRVGKREITLRMYSSNRGRRSWFRYTTDSRCYGTLEFATFLDETQIDRDRRLKEHRNNVEQAWRFYTSIWKAWGVCWLRVACDAIQWGTFIASKRW